jgi:hypothetical protein
MQPSREGVSRKSRAFIANQVVTEFHANQGHLLQTKSWRSFTQIKGIVMQTKL